MDEKERRVRNLIYLAGFMGSGKSTIGPILANTLGYQFVDVDRHIEMEKGKSITAIFKEDGEDAFRAVERNVLLRVSKMDRVVVSLGGGTVAHEENFQLIHSSGIIVYLQLSVEEAVRRMKHKTDRPMLRDHDGNALPGDVMEQRIRDLLAAREGYYRRAHIIVPTDRHNVGKTVDEIVKKVRSYISV